MELLVLTLIVAGDAHPFHEVVVARIRDGHRRAGDGLLLGVLHIAVHVGQRGILRVGHLVAGLVIMQLEADDRIAGQGALDVRDILNHAARAGPLVGGRGDAHRVEGFLLDAAVGANLGLPVGKERGAVGLAEHGHPVVVAGLVELGEGRIQFLGGRLEIGGGDGQGQRVLAGVVTVGLLVQLEAEPVPVTVEVAFDHGMVIDVSAVGHVHVMLALGGVHVRGAGHVGADADDVEPLGLHVGALVEEDLLRVVVALLPVVGHHRTGVRRHVGVAAEVVGRPNLEAELIGAGVGGRVEGHGDVRVRHVVVERDALGLTDLFGGVSVIAHGPRLHLIGAALAEGAVHMQGLLHMGHVGRDDGFRRSGGDAHNLEALAVHTLRGLPHQTVGLDADGLKVRSILRVGDAQHVVVRASHGVLGERERLALELLRIRFLAVSDLRQVHGLAVEHLHVRVRVAVAFAPDAELGLRALGGRAEVDAGGGAGLVVLAPLRVVLLGEHVERVHGLVRVFRVVGAQPCLRGVGVVLLHVGAFGVVTVLAFGDHAAVRPDQAFHPVVGASRRIGAVHERLEAVGAGAFAELRRVHGERLGLHELALGLLILALMLVHADLHGGAVGDVARVVAVGVVGHGDDVPHLSADRALLLADRADVAAALDHGGLILDAQLVGGEQGAVRSVDRSLPVHVAAGRGLDRIAGDGDLLAVVQIIDLLGGQLVPVGVEELAHAGIGLAGDGVVGIEQDIGPFAHRAVAVAGAADGSGVAHLLAHLHRARLGAGRQGEHGRVLADERGLEPVVVVAGERLHAVASGVLGDEHVVAGLVGGDGEVGAVRERAARIAAAYEDVEAAIEALALTLDELLQIVGVGAEQLVVLVLCRGFLRVGEVLFVLLLDAGAGTGPPHLHVELRVVRAETVLVIALELAQILGQVVQVDDIAHVGVLRGGGFRDLAPLADCCGMHGGLGHLAELVDVVVLDVLLVVVRLIVLDDEPQPAAEQAVLRVHVVRAVRGLGGDLVGLAGTVELGLGGRHRLTQLVLHTLEIVVGVLRVLHGAVLVNGAEDCITIAGEVVALRLDGRIIHPAVALRDAAGHIVFDGLTGVQLLVGHLRADGGLEILDHIKLDVPTHIGRVTNPEQVLIRRIHFHAA